MIQTDPGRGAISRQPRTLFPWAVAGVAGLAALLGAFVWWVYREGSGAVMASAEQVALGREVYLAHCASCHGKNLEGQPSWQVRNAAGRLPAPPHDESGHTWHHPDQALFEIVKHGLVPPIAPQGYESDMPGFQGKLTDEQIWAVLAYIESTWPNRVRQLRAERAGAQ